MPTPFYHAHIAELILADARLPAETHTLLSAHFGAFAFGKTAPDVQTVAAMPRESTHFFTIPDFGRKLPWERMLKKHRALTERQLPDAQRAFLAGYLCHLQADWVWVHEIFMPYFGPDVRRLNFKENLYYHNVLRASIEMPFFDTEREAFGGLLGAVNPAGWLPFVGDAHLAAWRDYLAGQVRAGGEIETVAVFARRARVAPEEMRALIEDAAQMDEHVFSRIPRETLIEYRDALVTANIELLTAFLAN